MYVMTHPKRGETTVQTELSYMRHLEAGWVLKEPQEKAIEQKNEEPQKRTRKAKQ